MTASTPTGPRVVYIMGLARSGSTLLGMALGALDDCVYVGELTEWPERAGRPNGGGEVTERFWKRVAFDVETLRVRHLPSLRRWIDHPVSLLLRLNRPRYNRLRRAYRALTLDLLASISHQSGCTTIVDSSHYPLRFRELSRLTSSRPFLIFLTRDSRSVVASLAKDDQNGQLPRRKGLVAANVYCWITSLLSWLAYLTTPAGHRLAVRYEDFVAEPTQVLGMIAERAVISAQPAPDLGRLVPGPIFQGNPIRLRDEVIIDRSIAESAASSPGSILTTVIQFPWLVASGYIPAPLRRVIRRRP